MDQLMDQFTHHCCWCNCTVQRKGRLRAKKKKTNFALSRLKNEGRLDLDAQYNRTITIEEERKAEG